MVDNLFKSVVLNSNITTNIKYYENLRNIVQEECKHLPIILGESSSITVIEDGKEIPKKYKKCLLCGADISFGYNSKLEFDARNYLKKEFETFEDLEHKYLVALELFKYICQHSFSEEEVYLEFYKKLNEHEYLKILKKSNTTL